MPERCDGYTGLTPTAADRWTGRQCKPTPNDAPDTTAEEWVKLWLLARIKDKETACTSTL